MDFKSLKGCMWLSLGTLVRTYGLLRKPCLDFAKLRILSVGQG